MSACRRFTTVFAFLMVVSALSQAATHGDNQLKTPVFDSKTLTQACERVLEVAEQDFSSLASLPIPQSNVRTVLQAWDNYSARLEDVLGPVYILTYTHPDKILRDAGEACVVKMTAFETALFQRPDLYARVQAVKTTDSIDAKLKQDLLDAFKDTGVDLPLDKRERTKAIIDRTQLLSQEFSRNLRENKTKLIFSVKEQLGLPTSYIDRVKKLEDGSIEVGFDYPDYIPFMRYANSGAARERYFRAFSSRGGERNLAILDEVVRLRLELAELQGLDSYAELITRRKMVGHPDTVMDFLDEVEDVVLEVEEAEIEVLNHLKSRHELTPSGDTELQYWDKEFYLERLRKQEYNIDQQALRAYFPTVPTLEWILRLSSDLYGIEFRAGRAPLWHEDVLYYQVVDSATQRSIGAIYLDLYPRAGKYGHAAAFPIRGSSTRLGRKPITALVTNFNREGLTQGEVETFLHEFGHALHGVLSKTRYVNHAGTQVERDFVEAPSQMYEAWARDPQSLALMAEYCEECPTIDTELAERLNAARQLGQGLQYARQWLYASFDMSLASDSPDPAQETWEDMEDDSALGHPEGNQFPGTFAHIVGGYAAGYYGYMWSEVIALDMLSAYQGDLMDSSVGKAFREKVLARGAELPASQMVRDFLGREPNSKAFFAEIQGKKAGAVED